MAGLALTVLYQVRAYERGPDSLSTPKPIEWMLNRNYYPGYAQYLSTHRPQVQAAMGGGSRMRRYTEFEPFYAQLYRCAWQKKGT